MCLAHCRKIVLFVICVVIGISVAECTCTDSEKKIANLLDDIEEFYNQKFSGDLTRNQQLLMNVAIHPGFLDFGTQPLSSPKRLEVTLHNLDADHSFEIVATFGTHEAFVWSKMNQTSVYPLSSASFNVTFLPYKIGAFEGSIYISTTRGQVRYQAFGTSYMNPDYIIPFINVDDKTYNGTRRPIALLNAFNPYPHSIQVGSIALYAPPSKSLQVDNKINGTKVFRVNSREPMILVPHQTTTLFTLDFSPIATMHWAVISYCHCFSRPSGCSGYFMHDQSEIDGNPLENLQVIMVPTSYASEPGLMSQTSLLHFGTVSEQIGAMTKEIKVVNPLKHDITITRLEADLFYLALSLNLTVRSVPARSMIPRTIATLTISPANISRSCTLTGFVTIVTNVKTATVRVPFFARLIHGALILREQRVVIRDASPMQLRFDYILHNQADVPISVIQPHLPSVYRNLIQMTYNEESQCQIFVQPGSEISLFSLSMRNGSQQNRVTGQFSIYTNISTQQLTFDVFSGALEIQFRNARLLNGVYDFGTVLLNEQGRNTIVLYNRNPIDIDIEAMGVTTLTDPLESWRMLSARTPSETACATVCILRVANKSCVTCPTTLLPDKSTELSVTWGGFAQPTAQTGFIVLKSTYQRLIQPFRFNTAVGRLTMLPNPMTVNDLFPGKTVRRNVIIQSSYPDPVKLTQLHMEANTSNSINFVRIFRQRPIEQTSHSESGFLLHPQKPTIVATALFDPSSSCIDILSVSESLEMPTDVQSYDKLICHTGFSLDSAMGLRWLESMTADCTNRSQSLEQFRDGLILSAATYAQLRAAWMAQTKGSTKRVHSLVTYLILGVDDEKSNTMGIRSSSLFWGDLSASLIWPRLVSSRKLHNKKIVPQCLIRSSGTGTYVESDSKTTLEQALRAHFPPTIPGESVQCDLVLTNPSDRPVLVQPILLDTVYTLHYQKHECENSTRQSTIEMEPLISFLHALGVPASIEHVTKLTHLLSGTFRVELVNGSQSTGSLYEGLPSPDCCPILLLPATTGQIVLRLTFTPNRLNCLKHSANEVNSSVHQQHTSYNLLFLRNNLTAMEPIWLNARLGQASVSLGMIDTNRVGSDFTGNIVDRMQNDRKIADSEPFSLHVRGDWTTVDELSDTEQNASFYLRDSNFMGHWISSTIPSLTVPRMFSPVMSLEFDFGGRVLWPFCYGKADLQLAYNLPEPYHFDLLDDTESTSGSDSDNLRVINHSDELLTKLLLRRRLVLFNSGDVPIELLAIMLIPGSNTPGINISVGATFNASSEFDRFTELDYFSCSYRGFSVHPCLRYNTPRSTDIPDTLESDKSASRNVVSLAPGEQLILDVRYRPDFVYAESTAHLWIVAHPHYSGLSNHTIFAHCMTQNTMAIRCAHLYGQYRLAEVNLHATFSSSLLRVCLNALPRPWIEYTIWFMVVFLLSASLLGVMCMGCLDGHRLWLMHERIRSRLDRIPCNTQPNPDNIFRFDRLVSDPFGLSEQNLTVPISNSESSTMKPKSDCSEYLKKNIVSERNGIGAKAPMPTVPESKLDSVPFKLADAVSTGPGNIAPGIKSMVEKPACNLGMGNNDKDEDLHSDSDEEPWLIYRGSYKSTNLSNPLVKTATVADDRKSTKSSRKSYSPKLATSDIGNTAPEKLSGRTKKKSQRLVNPEDRASLSYSEQRRSGSLSVIDDEPDLASAAVKVSLLHRQTRKLTSYGKTTLSSRSKISNAPKTEAGIAAAVRATMRLSEELGSQSRRKSNGQPSDRLRDTRDKPTIPSSHSSASSSSGPDQDSLRTKSRSQTDTVIVTRFDKSSSMPHGQQLYAKQPQHHRTPPLTASGVIRLNETNLTNGLYTEDYPRSHRFNDRMHHSARSHVLSDYQPIAPYAICGTPLDFDLTGEYVSELRDCSLIAPPVGVCWPASSNEFDLSQFLPVDRATHRLPTSQTHRDRPPPDPHWDDAVVEICGREIWDSDMITDYSRSSSAQDAMDQIAADSRAFAESLLRLSSKPVQPSHSNAGFHEFVSSTKLRPSYLPDRLVEFNEGDPSIRNVPVLESESFPELKATYHANPAWKSPADPTERTERFSPTHESLALDIKCPETSVFYSFLDHSPPNAQPAASNCTTFIDTKEAYQFITPFFGELFWFTPTETDGCGSIDHNQWDISCTTTPFIHQTSIPCTNYFYELPQITMARRLSMLQHEGRQNATMSLQQDTSGVAQTPALNIDEADVTSTGWTDADMSDECNEKGCFTSTAVLQSLEYRRAHSASPRVRHSGVPDKLSAVVRPQRPSTLPGSIKKSYSSDPSSVGSNTLTSTTPTATPRVVNLPKRNQETSEVVTYQPWRPVDEIAKADLFAELGLDDTDQLLSFGPDFSYHQNSPELVNSDWMKGPTSAGLCRNTSEPNSLCLPQYDIANSETATGSHTCFGSQNLTGNNE